MHEKITLVEFVRIKGKPTLTRKQIVIKAPLPLVCQDCSRSERPILLVYQDWSRSEHPTTNLPGLVKERAPDH